MEDTGLKGGEGTEKEKGRGRRGSKCSENIYEDRASRGNLCFLWRVVRNEVKGALKQDVWSLSFCTKLAQ